MILSILIALYLTVIVWIIRNMSGIPLSEEDGIVYRWMWILRYFVNTVLWPIIAAQILIKRLEKN